MPTLRHPLRPTPALPPILLAALLAASLATGACGGGGPELDSQDAVERGRQLYTTNCGLCHGPDADGEGVRAPALSTLIRLQILPRWRR